MKVIIIGTSAAALACAERLRKESDAEITMIGREKVNPYFRPSLSHMILTDEVDPKFFLKEADFYKEKNINLVLESEVKSIDPEKKVIALQDKELAYDKLVLAVGSENFVPPIAGVDKEGIFNLKYLSDVEAINEYAKDKKNITIVGGGLLGIEAAWAFYKAGKKVTILEFFDRLMARQLCPEASQRVEDELRKIGIDVLTGKSTKEIQGDEAVKQIVLESGEVIPTDVLFFSVGVRPNVGLAKEAGLTVDRGIVVDQNMLTSNGDIYAIGDCSQIGPMVPGIWPLALQTGRAAADHILGKVQTAPDSNPPIAILKALNIGVYSAGDITKQDDAILKNDGENLKLFIFENNKLTGVNLIGDTKLSSKVPKWIKEGASKEMVESAL